MGKITGYWHVAILVMICGILTPLSAADNLPASFPSDPLVSLKKVGEAKLKVWFWNIYRSSLYTEDGRYDPTDFPQALRLHYLRDVKAKKLLKYTRTQWDRLDIYHPNRDAWEQQLGTIFPPIEEGDEIVLLVTEDKISYFYYNGSPIGHIDDRDFGVAMLRIWLDRDSKYPELREKLIGIR